MFGCLLMLAFDYLFVCIVLLTVCVYVWFGLFDWWLFIVFLGCFVVWVLGLAVCFTLCSDCASFGFVCGLVSDFVILVVLCCLIV